jgi:maltose O-acetyltransferase
MGFLLKWFDRFFSWFLKANAAVMPINFVKMIAYYHPDPYLRKIFWAKLGIKMGNKTLANLGLTVVRHHKGGECVIIGDNVSIAPNVTFITECDPNNGVEIKTYSYVKDKLYKADNIKVEDEVWIGAGVVIFPGVKLGKCCIIGAGSVVLDDTEPYFIYAGAPARKIRDIRTGKRLEGLK